MMKYIYVVQHFNPKNYEEKYIGAYASLKEAEEAVVEHKTYKGFKEAPEHFYIDAYELNKLYWKEGFYSVKVKVKKKEAEK